MKEGNIMSKGGKPQRGKAPKTDINMEEKEDSQRQKRNKELVK